MKSRGAIALIASISIVVIIVLALGAAAYFLFLLPAGKPDPEPEPIIVESSISEPPVESSEEDTGVAINTIIFPIDKYGPDTERVEYVSGEMILRIPRLELDTPVLNGVDDATLKDGVGLFDQALLPGPENRNVSIAGHRDIHGEEFYFIDTIQEGDFIFLEYKGKEYKYAYEQTYIVTPDDWEPVSIKDYSRVTLQSCTPINVASHRIFVTGRLVEINDVE